jgi:hypothetical protein
MLGVVNDAPIPMLVPAVATLYQLIIPVLAVALKFTVPAPHRLAPVLVAMVGISFTVAVTAVLVAVVHPFEVAST